MLGDEYGLSLLCFKISSYLLWLTYLMWKGKILEPKINDGFDFPHSAQIRKCNAWSSVHKTSFNQFKLFRIWKFETVTTPQQKCPDDGLVVVAKKQKRRNLNFENYKLIAFISLVFAQPPSLQPFATVIFRRENAHPKSSTKWPQNLTTSIHRNPTPGNPNFPSWFSSTIPSSGFFSGSSIYGTSKITRFFIPRVFEGELRSGLVRKKLYKKKLPVSLKQNRQLGHLKMDGWKIDFLLGRLGLFSGALLNFRECI